MKMTNGIIRWFPTILAVCSMISIYTIRQLDSIVHEKLYSHGLQFSYDWATPYWTMSGMAYAMGGAIIAVAAVLQVYLIARKTPVDAGVQHLESKDEEHWNKFRLGGGSTIKAKLVVKVAKRTKKTQP